MVEQKITPTVLDVPDRQRKTDLQHWVMLVKNCPRKAISQHFFGSVFPLILLELDLNAFPKFHTCGTALHLNAKSWSEIEECRTDAELGNHLTNYESLLFWPPGHYLHAF